jgi:hypothetical protein
VAGHIHYGKEPYAIDAPDLTQAIIIDLSFIKSFFFISILLFHQEQWWNVWRLFR